MNLSDHLKTLRYPGRFIVIGRDADQDVILYGATGRSPSSLARQFVQKGNEIFMAAKDEAVVNQGNEALLTYPAVRIFDKGIVVANGRHIENITSLSEKSAEEQLTEALSHETYEPDENKTPRITGMVLENSAALHIAREAPGASRAWPFSREPGKGLYIGTYIGDDAKPAPSFSGEPLSVELNFGSAEAAANSVFETLAPEKGDADYRVGVSAIYGVYGAIPQISIKNHSS